MRARAAHAAVLAHHANEEAAAVAQRADRRERTAIDQAMQMNAAMRMLAEDPARQRAARIDLTSLRETLGTIRLDGGA
eukprot:4646846-Pyramimonas_sp.AAC.1